MYGVYIDEASDLGIKRGTRWFVITAVIVPKNVENDIRRSIISIRNKFNLKEIHLRKLRDFYKVSYVISQIKQFDFTIVNILVDTDILPLKDSIKTYNYMCKILLEKVSWFIDNNNATGEIVLSSRGTKRDGELIDYINNKLLGYEGNKIKDVFTSVKSKAASEWDMLQLADICATSMFWSHEVNSLGFITPCHMNNLKNKLYRYNGRTVQYGMKYYSKNMIPGKEYFNKYRICDIHKK